MRMGLSQKAFHLDAKNLSGHLKKIYCFVFWSTAITASQRASTFFPYLSLHGSWFLCPNKHRWFKKIEESKKDAKRTRSHIISFLFLVNRLLLHQTYGVSHTPTHKPFCDLEIFFIKQRWVVLKLIFLQAKVFNSRFASSWLV